MSGSIITNRFRHHTMVEFLLPLMLVAVSAAQLARPLNFDEAIYFTIARDIRRLLVPAWTWDGHSYVLFANSPGLLLYLAAPLQQWSSGVNIVMTRLFIVTVFLAVPTVAVWSISRKRYGLLPAGIGVGLAFATSIFFDESFRFRLDMPLGAVSGAVLLFYHEAAQAENRRSISLLAAIVLIVISFWIKFQAVCALASVLTYWFHVRVSSRRPQFRHLGTGAISLTIAAVIGFVAWVTFMRFAAHHLAMVAETPFGHPQ